MNKAIFLDRDGVLNRTYVRNNISYPPSNLNEVFILDGVCDAIQILRQHHFLLICVTNQPDVARGTQTKANVELINSYIAETLQLDAIYTCYHDNSDACQCRKPAPGMLVQASQEWNISLEQSYLVGDRWSDIAAGKTVGCNTYLINESYSQAHRCQPDQVVADLYQAAQHIVHYI